MPYLDCSVKLDGEAEQPDLLAALRDAEPLSEIETIRFHPATLTRVVGLEANAR